MQDVDSFTPQVKGFDYETFRIIKQTLREHQDVLEEAYNKWLVKRHERQPRVT